MDKSSSEILFPVFICATLYMLGCVKSDSGTDTGSCEASNGACIFPFEYKGVSYNGCTTTGDYAPWCRTSTNKTEVWWGDCGSECKMHQDSATDTGSCKTSNGTCIFPFEYKGVSYNGCTTAGDYAPWCRTSTNKTEVWWGDCGSECKMHQGEATSGDNVATSLQFLNRSMESMETKFRDLQTSLESILEKMTEMQSTSYKHETPIVFSCTYNTPEITASTARLAGYAACDINVGNGMDNTTGIFTVTKAGKYRFTFMTLVYPENKKKVIIYLTKDAGGTVTYLARALAQSKIGIGQVQITITLDVIEEVAVGDKIYISITLTRPSMIPSQVSGYEQTYFTGEFISA